MSKKTRKRFTSQEKVAILRFHLLERTPVSDLCDQHRIEELRLGYYHSIPHSAFLQVSASTGFSSIPIGAIVARIRSPGLRNVPVAEPTPDGVPVAMMSPGSSVTN